jgi:hypothetical protein
MRGRGRGGVGEGERGEGRLVLKSVYCFSPLFSLTTHLPRSGGGLFGILGKYTNKFGKDPVVLLGMLVHFAAFYLIYLNIPAHAIGENIDPKLSYGVLFDPSK